MSNDFFNKSGNPASGSSGASSTVRNEFLAIEQGFDKLPTLTGNGTKLVRINAAGNALEPLANTAASIVNVPAGTIAATNVQTALNELDTEKAPLASPALTGSPTAPLQAKAAGSDTLLATTGYVKRAFTTQATTGTLDWNDVTNTLPGVGPTLLLGTATNGPGGSEYFHPLNIAYAAIDGTYNMTQFAIGYSTQKLWMRTRNSSVWSAWERVFTSSTILGTVSQSGGVPTGAVMEYGSNANGEYWRYAGGMQICKLTSKTGAYNVSSAVGSIFASGGQEGWTYPAAFIETPTFSGDVKSAVPYSWLGLGSAGGSSSTVVYFRVFSPVSIAAAPVMALYAVGRWF